MSDRRISGRVEEGIGVADMAVQSDAMEATGPYDRARALNAFKLGDVTFYWITRVCAISVLLILGGIILSLIAGAWPAMKQYGLSFLFTSRWAPSADPPGIPPRRPLPVKTDWVESSRAFWSSRT